MSGIVVAALAGLLMQQAAPHSSALEPYQAPVIRPFEPPSDFGRESAEGDAGTGPNRRPLAAPVSVDAYAGSYEYTPTDAEAAYEQGVASAEIRTDQTAGPLDGAWRITDESGRTLYDLVLSDDDSSGPVEGGWRGAGDMGGAAVEGGALTLDGLGAVTLERTPEGWRGQLTGTTGRPRPVTLSRPD